ncbi:histidinol-phosphate transaminase [Luethyella okanaganae]|uniref:Aromatic amino acid aminotransferase n=1 Tax=Luethyella okanaganae TaxID=69372 RepID=A0ABW1VHB3_9MICO
MTDTTPEPAVAFPSGPVVRLRPEIVALPAYKQGRPAAADAFKLSSNENPFDPLPSVVEAVADAVDFNRYPDATALDLRERLAAKHGVGVGAVHVGAGSVALLAQFVLATSAPGTEVVYSWRSFEAYPGLVTVAGATSVQVPNRADHGHDLPAMAAAVGDSTSLVIVCSPNNPTGTIVTENEFHAFMAAIPCEVLVVLDEAYAEFVGDVVGADGSPAVHGIPVLDRYPNLVVLRTFSKAYGLAGLRVGYAIGPVEVLEAARSTAIPLSVTGSAAAAALASLHVEDELLDRVRVIAARRDALYSALGEQGWAVPRPHGNFLWLPTAEQTSQAAEQLAAAGLVTRPFHPEGIRVSIGEPESVERLLEITGKIMESLPTGHPARRVA